MQYQTFSDIVGASDSKAKLTALQLPDLAGKSFLDIGCNEGFFCIHAFSNYAINVTGLDSSDEFIKAAKLRSLGMNIRYIKQNWDILPEEKFDVILFASALHYVTKPIDFFENIFNHLTDDGVLILECGLQDEHIINTSVTIQKRHDGIRYYPDADTLINVWLNKFSCRPIRKSVKQAGDELTRYVFHCSKKKTSVILISGTSGVGKSFISNHIGADIVINTDCTLGQRYSDMSSIFDFCNNWTPDEKNEFLEMVINTVQINKGTNIIAVEGFAIDFIIEELINSLQNEFRIWKLHR